MGGHILMVFFFNSIAIAAGARFLCNNRARPDFIGARNGALNGFLHKVVESTSDASCVRDCMLDPRCVSVNYFGSEKRCELNTATQSQFPGNFTHRQGSFYYDEDRGTNLLSDFASCKELLHAAGGRISSGVYTIFPSSLSEGLEVYCDMEGNDGGWIVFQRRQDGSVSFYRNWADYQRVFGDLKGEFWLGNDNLRALTDAGTWELRIDMEDWEGGTALVKYRQFRITGELYVLHLSSYSSESTVPDSFMEKHSGHPFSTKDNDNDEGGFPPLVYVNCAVANEGAWWYHNCHDCNLNGFYYPTPSAPFNQGIQWSEWKGDSYSLKKCSMKIRESNLN